MEIGWWCQTGVKNWVMSYELWVMSDEWLVMEIEWSKKWSQTAPNSPGLMWLSCLCWLPRQPHDKKANPISSLLGEPDVRCTAPWVQPTCFFKSSFNDMLLLSSMTLEKSDFSLMKSEPKCVGHTEDKRKETSKGHSVNKSWRKRFWLK